MLYRSTITRQILIAGGILAGVLLAFGDRRTWRSTPSLRWLDSGPIPLRVWGLLFIVYAALLALRRTRPAGFALGAILIAVFAVSILAIMHLTSASPKNIVVLVAFVDTIVFHLFAIRTSMALRDNDDGV